MKSKPILLLAATLLAGMALGWLLFSPQKPAVSAAEYCADDGTEIAYTCAMHPHILQKTKGNCPLCGMTLFQNVFKHFNNPMKVPMTPLAAQLAEIQTIKVGASGSMEQELRLTGRIVPDDRRLFRQIAHLPGIIEKLYVNAPGQYVKKGQPIAKIYSKELLGMIETFEYSKNSDGVIRSTINNLKGWRITDEQIKGFDIKKGDYHKAVDIFADFSGTVQETYVHEGDHAANDYMAPSTVLYMVADLSRVWAMFDLYEKDFGQVRVGDEVRFTVPAYPERGFAGKVAAVEPQIDPASRTASVRVEVDNPKGWLKPEMLANGTLTLRRQLPAEGIFIPKSAVLWTGERSIVYVKDPEYSQQPVFEHREVRLGRETGDKWQIISGLEVGEEVVTNGTFRIDAAAQLGRKHSMMNPAVEGGKRFVKN